MKEFRKCADEGIQQSYYIDSNIVTQNQVIDAHQQIQKNFVQNSFSPKVKHEAKCKDFQYEG